MIWEMIITVQGQEAQVPVTQKIVCQPGHGGEEVLEQQPLHNPGSGGCCSFEMQACRDGWVSKPHQPIWGISEQWNVSSLFWSLHLPLQNHKAAIFEVAELWFKDRFCFSGRGWARRSLESCLYKLQQWLNDEMGESKLKDQVVKTWGYILDQILSRLTFGNKYLN